MPRGIKGSGKSRKSNGDQPKKRGRPRKQVDILDLVRSVEETEATPKSSRGRKPKDVAVTKLKVKQVREPKAEDLPAAEAELIRKYPDRRIVPGSILATGAVKDFPGRRTVVIRCAECDGERRVCTSDVFHVSKCHVCSRKGKYDKKAKKPKNGEKKDEE